MNSDRERRLTKILVRQKGVISRQQAVAAGLSPRVIDGRLASSTWVRCLPGVYGLATVAVSWEQRLVAAWLWAGKGAVVSHRASACIYGLDGINDPPCELSMAKYRRSLDRSIILHEKQHPPSDCRTVGPVIATNPTRTIIDLASVVELESLEEALDSALRQRLTNVPRLLRRLDDLGGPGRRKIKALRGLLKERDGSAPTESRLEIRLLRLIRAARLPEPVRQFGVRLDSKRPIRIDLAYPDRMVAIECDGYRFHSGRNQWQKDLTRGNALTVLGWVVVHVTWEDLEQRPGDVLAVISRLLSVR